MENAQDRPSGGCTRGGGLCSRVREYILKEEMIRRGDAVVAGFSGGADSRCLFEVLVRLSGELGFVLEAVHVHHGLRVSAEGDLRFVEEVCRQAGVPCTIVRADAAALAEKWGTGVEEAGRRIRYEAFREAALRLEKERHAPCRIAVAHHREDQAETVLFHLCRGTGLRGAGGMRPVQGRVIRPLLRESRSAIEEYLAGQGLGWRTDETNSDTGYTRNYLRAEILPRLVRDVNPASAVRIAQFADACREAEEYLEERTRQAVLRCAAPGGEIRIAALRQEDPYLQGRILYASLAAAAGTRRDLGAVHIQALRRLCAGETDGRLSLPGRITAVRSAGLLFFLQQYMEREAPELAAGLRLPLSMEEYECHVFPFDGRLSSIPQKKYTKWFDYDKIGMFPVFRVRQPGDRMCIGPAASKKVARIMLDSKIPAAVRDRVVLPFAGSEALWIPGLRMGDRWKVSSGTRQILEIALRSAGGEQEQ